MVNATLYQEYVTVVRAIERKLDDPAEWGKIPVLTKEELRNASLERLFVASGPPSLFWRPADGSAPRRRR